MGTEYNGVMDENSSLFQLKDYVILSKLGRGSYGRVYLAKNKKNKYLYAIKKFNIEEGFPTSTLREINILKMLQHPNIISFYQVIVSEDRCYLVLDYMNMSLDMFIKDHEISTNLLTSFMFQLLQGILFCHNRAVLHRDIKSQNILVHHCHKIVKYGDFGLSRHVPVSSNPLTPTVVTLHYRCPELIQKTGFYSFGIDIWSLGCVFVEMILKFAPFRVDGEVELLYSWFRQLGVPTDDDMANAKMKFKAMKFTSKNSWVNSIKLLKETASSECFDLIMKMFIYNPSKRIEASEALCHDFFQNFDKSVVPAINEEHVGAAYKQVRPKIPQVLFLTAEEVESLADHGDQGENIDSSEHI